MQINDSLMAYWTNALESFDARLNEPLFSVTYGRDLPIRGDVTLATEATSFTRQKFAGSGAQEAQGLPVIAANSTSLPGVDIDGEKISTPFEIYGRELTWTQIELERSQKLGQPLDSAKFNALQSLYQLSADQVAYVGNGRAVKGLVNHASVTNVANATAPGAAARTADEYLKLFDEVSSSVWQATGYTMAPDTFLVPTAVFADLGMKLDNGSGLSVMDYVLKNCLSARLNGTAPKIRPLKWADKAVSKLAKDRIIAYVQNERFVRFPITAMSRQPSYVQGITYATPYLYGIGGVEVVYDETIAYRDL